jgi:hypothetical protein
MTVELVAAMRAAMTALSCGKRMVIAESGIRFMCDSRGKEGQWAGEYAPDLLYNRSHAAMHNAESV